MAGFRETVLKGETFFLEWADQLDLVCSQWRIRSKVWISYRIGMMFYIVGFQIWTFINKFLKYQWKFFTFLTFWAYIIFSLNSIIKAICAIKYYKQLKEKDLLVHGTEKTPLLKNRDSDHNESFKKRSCLLQFSWFMANVANTNAIAVTISFWLDGALSDDIASSIIAVQVHGINAVLAVVDTLLVAQPTLLLHFYQPLCFHFTYIAFTAFYYLAGGLSKTGTTYIYPWLNWEKPLEYLSQRLPMDILTNLACHSLLWVTAVSRRTISENIQKRKA